ncbi:MAG: hypothetical protein PHW15_02430 [Patescibacteria group bacterium]|jgi:Tol biopolymer transport system component|nr:hypothetical protein [Patescibacteria group bacterium]MDD5173111.1 hypothetical protein [Patescibacteria group bacterium]
MSEKTKKILIIILFIIIVIGLALLLYFVLFKEAAPVETVIEPEEEEVVPRLPTTRESWESMTISERIQYGLPALEWPSEEIEEIVEPISIIVPEIDDVADGGRTWVTPISDDPVKGATLSADGEKSIYYNSETGQFFSTDNFSNKELLTEQIFYNVEKINWAPTKNKAIIEYPDGFKIIYDFDTETQYTLPKNWEEFDWNFSGSQIAFKSLSNYPENSWLAIAQADGSQPKPIEHMGENADKVVVSWSPNNQVVAFSSTGEARGVWEQEILLIGQHQENNKSLIVDGRGFEPKWSPKGDKIIYSIYSSETNYRPQLYLVDAQGNQIGQNKKSLKLTTWAHKCTFNKDATTIYCAVPKNLPEGAGLVLELAEDSRDDFYKIDVATGMVSFLAEDATGGYDVENVYLSEDEDYLYFVDKNTERLRFIQLK